MVKRRVNNLLANYHLTFDPRTRMTAVVNSPYVFLSQGQPYFPFFLLFLITLLSPGVCTGSIHFRHHSSEIKTCDIFITVLFRLLHT
jgi:hypothetical protein